MLNPGWEEMCFLQLRNLEVVKIQIEFCELSTQERWETKLSNPRAKSVCFSVAATLIHTKLHLRCDSRYNTYLVFIVALQV